VGSRQTPPCASHATLGEEADAQGWINLQATYNFKKAAAEHAKAIAKEVQPRGSDLAVA
jgi:plasmid maintenance system antidote protein VapI